MLVTNMLFCSLRSLGYILTTTDAATEVPSARCETDKRTRRVLGTATGIWQNKRQNEQLSYSARQRKGADFTNEEITKKNDRYYEVSRSNGGWAATSQEA